MFVVAAFTARFDVQRSDKKNYSVATVVKVDFSGAVKRIMFHFAKTSSDRDEWVEFGSPRIAPLYSKVAAKKNMTNTKLRLVTTDTATRPVNVPKDKITIVNDVFAEAVAGASNVTDSGNPSSPKKRRILDDAKPRRNINPRKLQNLVVDPADEKSFILGG
jgi:mbt repeat